MDRPLAKPRLIHVLLLAQKRMTVSADEFIRRFLVHSLPPGFKRIRHYGLLANCHRAAKLGLCRRCLAAPAGDPLPCRDDHRDLYLVLTGEDLRRCPQCGNSNDRCGTSPSFLL